jgi:hypothetical protein
VELNHVRAIPPTGHARAGSLRAQCTRRGKLRNIEALVALPALVLGYVLKILEGWLQEARSSRRERTARRDEFQRVTLLDLQEAMADLARAAGEIQHFDSMQLRTSGQRTQLPEGMSDREFKARRRLAILRERVLDAELRRLVDEFAAATLEVEKVAWMRGSEAESDERTLAAIHVLERANARLGMVLRDLY